MIRSINLSVIVVLLSGCAGAASRAQPVRDTVRVAAPTGERAADRASVQAAFDAVQPGGTVAFAAGTYVIGGDGLVLRTPGIALIGHPAGTTLQGCTREQRIGLEANEFLEACGNGLVLAAEAQRVSNLRFESFSLALSIREATESEKQARSPGFAGGQVVENNSFHDGFSFQVVLDADSTIRIRRNVFRNTWHAVAIGGRNIHVMDNDIAVPEPERVPFGFAGVAIGIRPHEDGVCSSMVVAGNRIDGHTEAVAIAVFPQDPPGAECSHITIRDNEIVMRRVRMPDGSDEAGRLAIAPAIRLFNAQRLVGEGLMTWEEHWMPEGGWPAALSDGRISDVSVVGNHITGAVGVAIEAAEVTDSRILDNEIEVRPATTPEERDGLSVGGNGGPGVWVLLGLVDEVNGTPVWVSSGSEGTVVLGHDATSDNRETMQPPRIESEGASADPMARSAGSWEHSSLHEIRLVPTAPGVQLEVLDWGGSGLPLVFIPGLNMDAHAFDEFSPRFTGRHRVIAVTRRGHGASSWPESGYEPERLARDIEVVLDSLGLRGPVVLAGHSAGGIEITRIAADHPERVAGLIYIDAAYDNRTLLDVFEACILDASFMEAFNRMMPELYHHTQVDSSGTPFASPEIVDRMTPAMSASLDYAAVKAPALAIYHVPQKAEGIFLGTLEQTRECRDAVQRHLGNNTSGLCPERKRSDLCRPSNHGRERCTFSGSPCYWLSPRHFRARRQRPRNHLLTRCEPTRPARRTSAPSTLASTPFGGPTMNRPRRLL